jgi:hypothetical protein
MDASHSCHPHFSPKHHASSSSARGPSQPHAPEQKPVFRFPFPHIALTAASLAVRELASTHHVTWLAAAFAAIAAGATAAWLVTRG